MSNEAKPLDTKHAKEEMDPKANVEEQGRIISGPHTSEADDRIVELRDALRTWIMGGGFKPPAHPPTAQEVEFWREST